MKNPPSPRRGGRARSSTMRQGYGRTKKGRGPVRGRRRNRRGG